MVRADRRAKVDPTTEEAELVLLAAFAATPET